MLNLEGKMDAKNKQDLLSYMKEDPKHLDEVLARPPGFTLEESGSRKYTPKSVAAREQQYKKNKALRAEMLENRVPFIAPDFDTDFFLCQGMTLVCAMSGQSKSTTCANVLAGFVRYSPGKQVVVITNEEGADAVIDRAACVIHKKNYIDLYKGRMPKREREEVEDTSIALAKYVEVVDDPTWDMSCLEDVKAVLDHAATNGVALVLIDYLQTVTHSKNDPHLESFQISKRLGLYLKDYGRKVGVPVVVFAQLKPKSEGGALQDRIQNDKTIYNHAFNVIEVIPDFNTLLTKFIIHKGRFELKQGKEIVMKYDGGRYVMDAGYDI